MTENKRFYYVGDGVNQNSGVIDGDTELTIEETVGVLNDLADENEELKQTIETICKDYEEAHGMDIRNAEWFTCW